MAFKAETGNSTFGDYYSWTDVPTKDDKQDWMGEFVPFKNELGQKMVKFWVERNITSEDILGYDYNFVLDQPFKIGYKLQTMK